MLTAHKKIIIAEPEPVRAEKREKVMTENDTRDFHLREFN